MLQRLGRFAARHHWWFIAVWLVLGLTLGITASRAGGTTSDSFTIPGTQAQEAIDLLSEQFPAANGGSATVVVQAPAGQTVTSAANVAAIDQAYDALGKLDHATPIVSPLDPNSLTASNVSKDQTIVYASLQFDVPVTDLDASVVDQMEQATQPLVAAGMNVQFGGAVVDQFNQPESAISEHADDIGLLIAVIILLISLGSAVSMLMPIGTAVFSLGIATSLTVIAERFWEIGSVAPILGTMLGLGVGIDYALFIVSRYRQNLTDEMEPDEAVANAIATSGSSVLFAGITVCLAMVALGLMGVPYVRTLGLVAAVYVVVSIFAALTLLPAVLGLLGRRVNAGRLPWHHKVSEKAKADMSQTWSARWAREIGRRPALFAPLSLLLLLVLAVPLFKIELGFPTDGSAPSGTTQRKAYDLIEEGFGPGANGPLLIVGALPAADSSDQTTLLQNMQTFVTKLQAVPGVQSVTPGSNPPDYTIAFIQLIPTTGPNDAATATLVNTLRDTAIPNALQGTNIDPATVYVGGTTAELLDLTDRIDQRMPLIIGVVLLGSFLLLMMVFRSVFVPFKAAIMNLLSIGASYGVLVAVFEWGWGRSLIGLEETVIIAAFVPIMMFAILFGLSMDYEVFLLSRIREDYLETGDPHESIVVGLSHTARVITSAALIMIAVFLAFVTNPSPTVKMIGLGLAVAVFVDATIVRMILVPSTMELLGAGNWWLPKWLGKILPRLNIEGPPKPKAVEAEDVLTSTH